MNVTYFDKVTAADLRRADVLVLGATVETADGTCGDLRRLVVDPLTRTVTHLVVGAAHHRTGGHLVPRGLVARVSGPIRLSCDQSTFDALPLAEATEVLPAVTGSWAGGAALGMGPRQVVVVADQVPTGEDELCSSTPVESTEGFAGRCGGVAVDHLGGTVNHVLLEQGHLWGRRQVWIRSDDVTEIGETIRLRLTREQVLALPPHGHDHPPRHPAALRLRWTPTR